MSTTVISRGLQPLWVVWRLDRVGSGARSELLERHDGMAIRGGEGGDKEDTSCGRVGQLRLSQLSHSGEKEGRRKARNKDGAAERESGRAGSLSQQQLHQRPLAPNFRRPSACTTAATTSCSKLLAPDRALGPESACTRQGSDLGDRHIAPAQSQRLILLLSSSIRSPSGESH